MRKRCEKELNELYPTLYKTERSLCYDSKGRRDALAYTKLKRNREVRKAGNDFINFGNLRRSQPKLL